MVKKKVNTNLKVTGRVVAYLQSVDKSGKLGEAKPYVVTTVDTGVKKPVAKRKKK